MRIPNAQVPRFVVPRGPLALAVIAMAVVPILYRELVKQGKKVAGKEEAEKKVEESKPEEGTAKTASKPKSSVRSTKTTKRGANAGGVDVTTASPAGQEELEEQAIAEMDGAAAPPKSKPRARTTAEKAPNEQPQNPKRTQKKKS